MILLNYVPIDMVTDLGDDDQGQAGHQVSQGLQEGRQPVDVGHCVSS